MSELSVTENTVKRRVSTGVNQGGCRVSTGGRWGEYRDESGGGVWGEYRGESGGRWGE